jgi:hypothetical protein
VLFWTSIFDVMSYKGCALAPKMPISARLFFFLPAKSIETLAKLADNPI